MERVGVVHRFRRVLVVSERAIASIHLRLLPGERALAAEPGVIDAADLRATRAASGRPLRPFPIYGLAALGVASVFVLAAGGVGSLAEVETSKWGGLFITLLLSVTAMTCSVPVGVLLALGRGAKNPFFRALSNVAVEVVRGVPLLALLFMAVVLLPLFIPGGSELNLFARVVVGLCLYASAYMAEVIRGALSAVPAGRDGSSSRARAH